MTHLEEILKTLPLDAPKLIAFESGAYIRAVARLSRIPVDAAYCDSCYSFSYCSSLLTALSVPAAVNSMEGTVADINAICDLADRYNAMTFNDEVRATATRYPSSAAPPSLHATGLQPTIHNRGSGTSPRRLPSSSSLCVLRCLCVLQVHAVGLYGDRGAGIAERDGALDRCVDDAGSDKSLLYGLPP